MVKIVIREVYGQVLVEFGEVYKDIVVFDVDFLKLIRIEIFKKKFFDRFFNIGIVEQDFMVIVVGFVICGKILFVSIFVIFVVGRVYDQVRNLIGYLYLNVKIGVLYVGVLIGEDGVLYQMFEDIVLMRVIFGMVVFFFFDVVFIYECVRFVIEYEGFVYICLGRFGVDEIYKKGELKFIFGKGIVF